MRKIIICLISALSFAALPAYADRGGHGGHGGYGGRHHGGGSFWPGVAVVGALTGLAIIASRPAYVDPYPVTPVYGPPPVDYAPARAANTWYYCQSSGIYYPYTRGCPEGWQVVPARPY